MPIWIGDYLASTAHLTTQQHGVYLLLMMHYWTTQKPIPDDDEMLALIVRLPLKEWKHDRKAIETLFHIKDGAWFHQAMFDEIAKAMKVSKKRQELGRKGAAKRWNGGKDAVGH
jgi:uncharacterized protein YdaU (DUF1376 family)